MGSYQLITEVYTLKVMDKAISNMISKGITISNEDFEKFKVLETVTNIISRSQMELFAVKMKMTMLCMNPEKLNKAEGQL